MKINNKLLYENMYNFYQSCIFTIIIIFSFYFFLFSLYLSYFINILMMLMLLCMNYFSDQKIIHTQQHQQSVKNITQYILRTTQSKDEAFHQNNFRQLKRLTIVLFIFMFVLNRNRFLWLRFHVNSQAVTRHRPVQICLLTTST